MTDLPPKPGHTITFTMPLSMSTLKVNRLIMDTTNKVLLDMLKVNPEVMTRDAEANKTRNDAGRYLHGFGDSLRDRLVAEYRTVPGLLTVYYPPNYHGDSHPSTDDWARARVAIWDALLFALGGPGGAGGVTQSIT